MKREPKPQPQPMNHERTYPSGKKDAPDMKYNGKPLKPY